MKNYIKSSIISIISSILVISVSVLGILLDNDFHRKLFGFLNIFIVIPCLIITFLMSLNGLILLVRYKNLRSQNKYIFCNTFGFVTFLTYFTFFVWNVFFRE
jgi:hypothetical protein